MSTIYAFNQTQFMININCYLFRHRRAILGDFLEQIRQVHHVNTGTAVQYILALLLYGFEDNVQLLRLSA